MALSLARRAARRLVPPGGVLEAAPRVGIALFGIPVQLDVWCLVAVALTAWTLADAVLPLAAEGQPTTAYWAAAGLIALALLASVAVHELAHGLAARRARIGVRRVTLTLFGGSTVLDRQPPTLRSQVEIALAGPLASLALAAGATMVHVAVVESGGDGLAAAATAVIAVANLAVALINLLPAAPLDGGLVLQAMLARLPAAWVDGRAAAALAGRALGGALIGLAVVASASGDVVIGLWSAVLGFVVRDHAS